MAEKPGKWTFTSLPSVAKFCGVGVSTITAWRSLGMPGQDRAWNMQAIIRWLCRQRKVPIVDPAAVVETDESGVCESSPALEKKREYEAQLRRLDLEERRRQLVDATRLQSGLSEFTQLVRTGGESLGRTYGPDVQDALNEILADATAALEKTFGTDGNRTARRR